MATHRRPNTATVLPQEEETFSPTAAPRTNVQPNIAQSSKITSGPSDAVRTASAPVPKEPAAASPMAQNKYAADHEQRIRGRAFEINEARGRQDGHADEDWLLAEEEITGITGGG